MAVRCTLGIAVVACLAAACSRPGAPTPEGTVPKPPAERAQARAPAGNDAAAGATPLADGFGVDARGAPVTARGPEAPVLMDVRSGEHEGYDRMVFEFAGDGLPQWRVEWVEVPITDCGAGQVVPVGGTAWLQVRFNGAAAHTPEGKATSGPRQRRLRHPVLRDLVRTCDFEGEVTWVAGLAGRHPFRAQALAAPPRLVVDIAH